MSEPEKQQNRFTQLAAKNNHWLGHVLGLLWKLCLLTAYVMVAVVDVVDDVVDVDEWRWPLV